MKRGDVYWCSPGSSKRRPVLILTRDAAIGILENVTVAPITSTIRNIPTEVELSVAEGFTNPCAVNCDNILTIKKSQLDELISEVSFEKMIDVETAIEFALGFIRMSLTE